MNANVLDALVDAIAEKMEGKYKHDLPTGFTLTTNYMHGPGGIFSAPGVERDVFATRIQPRGLLSMLPAQGTVDQNPIQPYLTGFTDESGDEADAVCDDCVQAGEIKSCFQGTFFGRVCRETEPLELNRVGQRINRGEFMDLRLVNDPLLSNDLMTVPGSVPKSTQSVLNREVLARWLTLGVAFENKLSKLIWTGNPTNNSAGGGYMEYSGLESLVATGHTDVLTSTSCPSLDSDIKDANYASVEDDALTIYYLLQMIYRYVRHNAEHMGMLPVQWVWVMKDALFRQLTDRWPCVYATGRCNATANDLSANVDAMVMRRMSDELYNGRYLTVDGVNIPVVLDDYIPYETAATDANLDPGEFLSDIYLLPLTVRGGRPVTYMEYFDYSAANGTMQGIMDGRLTNEYWTDGGRFLWTFSRTNWCVNWKAKIEPRLRLLTPHLAGRLQNVKFAPLQMFREPDPDQAYFVDGGNVAGSSGWVPYDLRSAQ